MSEWTVTVVWDSESYITVEILDRVAEYAGAVAGNVGERRLEATVTAGGTGPQDALASAVAGMMQRARGTFIAGEVLTIEEHDRRLAEPAFPELVGISEVAQLLGVSRQRASALQTNAAFPGPVALLASGPVWRKGDLSRFAASWERKSGRPKKEASFTAAQERRDAIRSAAPSFIDDPVGYHEAKVREMAEERTMERLAFSTDEDT